MAQRILHSFRSFPGFSRQPPFSIGGCGILQIRSFKRSARIPVCLSRAQENSRGYVKKCAYAAIITACGFSCYSFLKKNGLLFDHLIVYGKESDGSKFRQQFNFFADVIEKAKDSVVLIESEGIDFHAIRCSRGSGFIISSDGLIVTNAHVVGKRCGETVKVFLPNKKLYRGVIKKLDEQADLAIVKINCTHFINAFTAVQARYLEHYTEKKDFEMKDLPVLPMGTVHDLKAGEWVAAIGSPFHLTNTATVGVVSSSQRDSSEMGLPNKNIKYIQTDAAITCGNSGGPLVNLDGEVVGVNALALNPGIAFAIPIEYVKELLLRDDGEEVLGLDVGIVTVTLHYSLLRDLAQRGVKLPDFIQEGLFVYSVMKDSQAHKVGLLPGDIIFEAENKPVKSLCHLHDMLKNMKKLTLKVLREGEIYNAIIFREKM